MSSLQTGERTLRETAMEKPARILPVVGQPLLEYVTPHGPFVALSG
ncbi:MAG: hypothetical protein K2G98_02190, partial [Duncaniella sp.]|nr:hypothetical protein [Duncaniella sp.]